MILKLRQKGAHDITILDAREESHVFVNGVPFFWYLKPEDSFVYARYNFNKSAADIEADEDKKVADLKTQEKAHVFGLRPTDREGKGWPDVTDCFNQDSYV